MVSDSVKQETVFQTIQNLGQRKDGRERQREGFVCEREKSIRRFGLKSQN